MSSRFPEVSKASAIVLHNIFRAFFRASNDSGRNPSISDLNFIIVSSILSKCALIISSENMLMLIPRLSSSSFNSPLDGSTTRSVKRLNQFAKPISIPDHKFIYLLLKSVRFIMHAQQAFSISSIL